MNDLHRKSRMTLEDILSEIESNGYRWGIWSLKEGYNCYITLPVYLQNDNQEYEHEITEAQGKTFLEAVYKAYALWKGENKNGTC